MGFFAKKFDQWAGKEQEKELNAFISNLQAMDGPEIGHVVAVATNIRHKFESVGHIILDPINYVAASPKFPFLLSRAIIQLQKDNEMQEAAGIMVWLHTFRSAARLELRSLGREMWKELERGFPYIEESAMLFWELTGRKLDIDGATSFPIGLTPDPI